MINEQLVQRAREYAEKFSISLSPTPLGFGDDGAVWTTSRHTVLKAFERRNNYAHELECYQRLGDALFALRKYGIWYFDAKPGNVALENWKPDVDA